jgi:hypothetical protein
MVLLRQGKILTYHRHNGRKFNITVKYIQKQFILMTPSITKKWTLSENINKDMIKILNNKEMNQLHNFIWHCVIKV